ncbi:MAG: hypothetical protein ACRDNS_34950 [Trebonia sp.]
MAAAVVLLAFAAVMTGCVLLVRVCLGAIRRHREQVKWDDLVSRHQELDRELENIWQRR